MVEARVKALELLDADDAEGMEVAPSVLKSLEAGIVRSMILETGSRIDGRDTCTVRPIEVAG